jgi:hypothetical protein
VASYTVIPASRLAFVHIQAGKFVPGVNSAAFAEAVRNVSCITVSAKAKSGRIASTVARTTGWCLTNND